MTAFLCVSLALALPECRAAQVGDELEFRFVGLKGLTYWHLTRLPVTVTMESARTGDHPQGAFHEYVLRMKSPGVTPLVFQYGEARGAPRHVVLLFVSPRKAGDR